MLWQPHYAVPPWLIELCDDWWETVWRWHAQMEKCNQVSSWPMSVEVVSLLVRWRMPSASLPFVGLFVFFSSVLVNTAVVVRSIVWNTFVARASWSLFFSSQGLLPGSLFVLSFMSWSVWKPCGTDIVAVQRSVTSIVNWWISDSSSVLTSPRVIAGHTSSARVITVFDNYLHYLYLILYII